jgi:NADPH-dependent curcumin reductase CurA
VQESFVSEGKGMQRFDAKKLPHPGWALSLFGATGLTAYFGLVDIGKPKPGEVLVVSAAAGAVGSAVVQLGKALGLTVVGIAGGAEKCAYLREALGADAAIDYKAGDISAQLRQHCPDGVDIYFDNVGGDILDAVLKRLRRHARIVLCGGISQYNAGADARGPANYLSLIAARGRMEGFVVIDYLHRAEEAITAMTPFVQAGRMTSKLDIVPGLERFPEALRRVYTGANFGKQLVELPARA